MNELILAEVRVEKTFIIDDPDIRFSEIGSRSGIFPDIADWVKRKTVLGKRIGVYSFGTYFSAFIDLSTLAENDVIVDDKKGSCTITLPAIQIKEWGRDFDLETKHERVSIYRSPLTPQEKAEAKNQASRILKEEMDQNVQFRQDLIKSAEDKAESYFGILLSEWGYQVQIKFRENNE